MKAVNCVLTLASVQLISHVIPVPTSHFLSPVSLPCIDVLNDSVTIYITVVDLDACEVGGVQLVFDFCLQMFKCSFTHEVTNIFLRICTYVY